MPKFLNHYTHCGRIWSDLWDSKCNDRCPVCRAEIEPHASDKVDDTEAAAVDVTKVLLSAADEAETALAVVQLCDDLTPQARSCANGARRQLQDAIALAKPGSVFAEAVTEARKAEHDELVSALKSCILVLAGIDMTKSSLVRALENGRDILEKVGGSVEDHTPSA
ncbi:hypothetical protein [Oryzomonas rubra]|uniref:Uncharacterized protein n=1 Tax=Oryzomonas rubra TaxID=2509454 RepID=A0A5A9X8M2_9BACT|nr:hypothetical protein [Oryzomonas rubra]KAA0888745.1 hypothetical protein ET418_15305 [Oryzomonas rubra]